ncbi:uncharacterized protein LOC129572281, partial [Sitodiplosis mosellana]|uniref:uncharacterized protein LOC129572281 n=1 Tax=Sitodiplosis mosellana TaxID=263140 RepID=UPI002444AE27
MVTPGVDACAYCKTTQNLDILNNNELLEMMRQHKPDYGRTTRFCGNCKSRALAKLNRRKLNAAIAAKKATRSAGEQTTSSYSNASRPFLSNSSSSGSTSKRRREE